jgi:peptidoglycan/LPS O-acetylase OafA/YrhL
MSVYNINLSQLNLIRGFLAMYVLVGHCANATGVSLKPLPGAGHAVDVFMILSGFLMALYFHEREKIEPWEKPSTLLYFYTRRFFRIAPVYYLFLFVAILFLEQFNILMTIHSGQTESNWNPELTSFISNNILLTIIMHVTFLFGLVPSFVQDNILPDWSISLEMQFYAVFPFIMLLIRKIGYTIPVIIFSIIYLIAPMLF